MWERVRQKTKSHILRKHLFDTSTQTTCAKYCFVTQFLKIEQLYMPTKPLQVKLCSVWKQE